MDSQHRFFSVTTLALVAVAGIATACAKSGDQAATHDVPAATAAAPDTSATAAPGAMAGMKGHDRRVAGSRHARAG